MATTLSTKQTSTQRLTSPRARPLASTFRGLLTSLFVVVLLTGSMTLSDGEQVGVAGVALKASSSTPIAPPSLSEATVVNADDVVRRHRSSPRGANSWLRDRSSDEKVRGAEGRAWQLHPIAARLTSREVAELRQFLAGCRQRVESWRIGRAIYPGTMAIQMHQMATYRVEVDIDASRTHHSPPSDDFRFADMQVRCGIGARLTSEDEGLVIEDEGDWIKREFDASATVNWVWTVHANRAGLAQVRLDFRPAVEVVHGGRVVPGNEDSGIRTETYVSNIAVEAAVLDAADDWVKNDFPKICGIAAAIGAAVIAIIAWVRRLLRAARDREDGATETPASSEQQGNRGGRLRRRRHRRAKPRESRPR